MQFKKRLPYLIFFLLKSIKSETSANTQESEQHDLVYQEIETEIKLYLAEENLSAQKVKEAEVLSWCNSNKKNALIWPGLQEDIFRHHHLLFYPKGYFQKLVTYTNKSEIDFFQKPAKNCYFYTTT